MFKNIASRYKRCVRLKYRRGTVFMRDTTMFWGLYKKIRYALYIVPALLSFSYAEPLIEVLASKDLHGKNLVPVAVIGAGPAGLGAAIYTARAGLPTIVFMGPGDTLTQAHHVENWPGKKRETGAHIIEDLQKQAASFGAVLVPKTIEKVDFSGWPRALFTEDGEKIHALAVIVATGGSPKTLDVPGVKEYWEKGIRICAICDAPFDKGKEVAVVGGGDIGVDKALQLTAFAKKVIIFEKEADLTAMMAAKNYVAQSPNIVVTCNAVIKQIKGDGSRVTSVEVLDKSSGKTYEVPVQSVYFAIGFTPNTNFLHNALSTDEEGYIVTHGKTQKTSVEGVFAAGSVEDSLYQKGGTAIGRGFQAGLDAIKFLTQQGFNKEIENQLSEYFYRPETFSYALPEIKSLQELTSYIQKNPTIVLNFYSPSCSMCKAMVPIIEKVASQYYHTIPTVKINIEEHAQLATHYQVSSVPTLLMLKNDHVVSQISGRKSNEELKHFFTNA